MGQRSAKEISTKLVYYGPGFSGKSTNLRALHHITDLQEEHQLLMVKNSEQRTPFFDLLRLELGPILDHRVRMKIFTVPGHVRYETTRRVVLAGADAVVFVADSRRNRKDQNVWSLQNLRLNLRANGADGPDVPVLFQFNKQDVPGVASPEEVAGWLGVSAADAITSVATEGQGVLEGFMAASRAMLKRAAGDDRLRADPDELDECIDRAFEPYKARKGKFRVGSESSNGGRQTWIALDGSDLLEESIRTSTQLGEKLTSEFTRVRQLERELRELCDRRAARAGMLGDLSEVMLPSVATILSTALAIRDRRTNAARRKELVGAIIESAERIKGKLDDLPELVSSARRNRT